MAALTRDEKALLEQYDVPDAVVFDARRIEHYKWRQIASSLEPKPLVYIAEGRCVHEKHRLCFSDGRCVQCRPMGLVYARRHNSYTSPKGFVYVAESAALAQVKVGFTEGDDNVAARLNREGYGDARDWVIKHSVPCKSASVVKAKAHEILSSHYVPSTGSCRTNYGRDGFTCSVDTAYEAVIQAVLQV
jgi:hypothetical protein